MLHDELVNTLKYKISEKIIKELLQNQLITPEEYRQIDIFNRITFSINSVALYQ